jgi:hypothetical protein
VRRLPALLVLATAGCCGFEPPTDAQLDQLFGPGPRSGKFDTTGSGVFTRCRFRMSVDSPWLAGEFDGIVVARSAVEHPVLRMQLFSDVGPKVVDLRVSPDRMVGYFPQTREGIDCALPAEAAPHPLLFIGASLADHFFAPAMRSRVTGIRESDDGWSLRLDPIIEGVDSRAAVSRAGTVRKRAFSWVYGAGWEEEPVGARELRITAPRISIRVTIQEEVQETSGKPGVLDLTLPDDVRIVAGSRK